jgi:hypothetical protein
MSLVSEAFLFGCNRAEELAAPPALKKPGSTRGWIEKSQAVGNIFRDGKWTECMAAVSVVFAATTKRPLE